MSSMKVGLIVLGATLLALGAFKGFNKNQRTTPIAEAFTQWTQKYGANYASPSERAFRLRVFAKNYLKVKHISQDKQLTYSVELNEFADQTLQEFIAKRTGLIKSENTYAESPIAVSDLKDSEIDWREKKVINKVKDQGQCGSCWAFSAIGSLEPAWAISGKQLADFSEQQLVDCSTSFGNHGCNGGLMTYAFDYITKGSKGIETTSEYPYHAKDEKCKFDASKIAGTMTSYDKVKANDCDQLLTVLQKQPVSVAIDANGIMFYKKGIFNSSCGTHLNHGVTLVGYGTEGSTHFWIVRNSWGTSWGESGYIKMERDDKKNPKGICGVCMDACYPNI